MVDSLLEVRTGFHPGKIIQYLENNAHSLHFIGNVYNEFNFEIMWEKKILVLFLEVSQGHILRCNGFFFF